MNLRNISLENVKIDRANKSFHCIDANGIRIKKCNGDFQINPPALYLKNAKDVTIEVFNKNSNNKEIVKVEGALTENISLRKADFSNADQQD